MATKKTPIVKKTAFGKSKVTAKKIATVKSKVVKKPTTTTAKHTKVVSINKKPETKSIGKISRPFTKTELLRTIAANAELNSKQVAQVFASLTDVIAAHLKKDGPEKFVLPGLLKIVIKEVPAKPAREGINPFTKEPTVFKAKPASKKVKLIALSGLKSACK